MKVKVSNYIAQKAVAFGICQVFTVVGGGAMHLNDALGHQAGLSCLYQHHEQACAISAEAYARIHNKMALLCVTTGPGGTNAITGVVGGWLDSIPMLVLSGQVRYDTTARWSKTGIRAMGDQEFDITRAVACMTKYCEMVIDPKRIRFCLEKAFYLAQSGRPGPCWLDIPLDVQGAFVEVDELAGFDPADYEAGGTGWAAPGAVRKAPAADDAVRKEEGSAGGDPCGLPVIEEDLAGRGEPRQALPPAPDRDLARRIIEKIRSSERPVFNAGNGIRIAGAHGVFIETVSLLGIPVVTGWNSIDCVWDEHPLYAGRPGHMGDRPGNFAVQNSDLLFSVGSRLSIRQVGFNYRTWAREAYVIVEDVDAEELKKPSLHIDLPVHADAKDLLTVMVSVLREEYGASPQAPLFKGGKGLPGLTWIETCRMWRERYPVVRPEMLLPQAEKPANVYAVIYEVSRRLSRGQITVVGNGSACVVGGHAYMIKEGQRFLSNSAIASMGYDLPAAIGACMAARDPDFADDPAAAQDIILLTGEGSIQMNLQELQTIITHRLPIKIFLINNGGYHSIRQTQLNHFGEPLVGIGLDSGDLSFPDMGKLAVAYGYPYIAAHSNPELADAVAHTLALDGPAICECFVSWDQNFEPKAASKQLPDGRLVSTPLEDLAPFLPEEELDAMMIIPRIRD